MRPVLRASLTPIVAACAAFGALAAQAQEQQQERTLAPVVVTGKGFEQRAFDTPYSVNVIEAETLRNGGLMVNLSESMARVPGLTVNNRNNYAQDLQISSRGYGARSTFGVRGLRLYSDGIPATGPDGQGQVSHFDLAGAQRVEVLRGPFSALYGNSSGGVIAVFSAPVRERYAEVGLDVARFGTRQGRITLQAPLSGEPGKGWDIRVGASAFETDGFRPQSEAERKLANVRLGYTGERDTVVIALNHLDQPALDALGLTRADFDANPRSTDPAATTFNTRKTTEQDQIGATWRHRFDGLGALSESAVTAYYGQRSVTQWQSIPPATQAAPRQPGGVIDFDRDYTGIDGRLTWRWTLSEERSAQFVAGAAYERSTEDRRGFENFIGSTVGVTGALRRDERNKVDTRDAFAQGEFEFVKGWTGTLGVRTGKVQFDSRDHYCRSGAGVQVACTTPGVPNADDSGSLEFSYTNPVAALQWKLTPDLQVYLSAGRGFESPTFNELAYQANNAPGFNRALRPQKSLQAELGAKWRDPARGLSAEAAVFEARTENEISVATNTGGRSSFQNVGDTTRRGVEFAAGWEPTREWRGAVALTWLKATYDDSFLTCAGGPPCGPAFAGSQAVVPGGNRIAGTSPKSGFAEVAWRPGGSDRSEVGVEWRGQGRIAVNDRNSDFASGWSTWALRASQAWTFGDASRLEALVRVDNLLDKDYAGSVIVNEGNSRFFEPAAPRTWYVGLKWRQGF